MSSPAKWTLPVLGCRKPVRALKSVDLPAPLGPIRATMLRSAMSRLTASTATSPPNRTRMSRACSSGAVGTSLTENHLPLFAEHSLWAVAHKQHQQQADHDESQ